MSEVETLRLPETGFIRLKEVLQFIPVGKTRWYEGVKTGEYPKGIEIAPRVVAYRAEDIRALINKLGNKGGEK